MRQQEITAIAHLIDHELSRLMRSKIVQAVQMATGARPYSFTQSLYKRIAFGLDIPARTSRSRLRIARICSQEPSFFVNATISCAKV